jgi:DNA-binding NarL/FixJ family response regulator
MLEGIRGLLEDVFDVVLMVADEKSLIDAIEKFRPDIVIVDLSMPVAEECNVVCSIRKINTEVKIIILSVHDEYSAVDECISAGATGFILKRTAINDLIPAIEEVLRGGTYISPFINKQV